MTVDERHEQARRVARLINDEGLAPSEACKREGLDLEEDVSSEDASVFDLDEDHNDIVDFLGWEDDTHFVLIRSGERHKTPWVVRKITEDRSV